MIVNHATFSKKSKVAKIYFIASILKISSKAFRNGYSYPYPVPAWKQFLDIRIRLQTHYPTGYPTGKPDSDHLRFASCTCALWLAPDLDSAATLRSVYSKLRLNRLTSSSPVGRKNAQHRVSDCAVNTWFTSASSGISCDFYCSGWRSQVLERLWSNQVSRRQGESVEFRCNCLRGSSFESSDTSRLKPPTSCYRWV